MWPVVMNRQIIAAGRFEVGLNRFGSQALGSMSAGSQSNACMAQPLRAPLRNLQSHPPTAQSKT